MWIGREPVARSEEFTQQNTELAMQAAEASMNWFRQIVEQNLLQNRAICEHSMSLAERAVANTLDCGLKMARLREPQELVQVQTDFLSRQAQAFADQARELNERLVKEAQELTNTFVEATRRQSKAA
jgi:hypothetical protein